MLVRGLRESDGAFLARAEQNNDDAAIDAWLNEKHTRAQQLRWDESNFKRFIRDAIIFIWNQAIKGFLGYGLIKGFKSLRQFFVCDKSIFFHAFRFLGILIAAHQGAVWGGAVFAKVVGGSIVAGVVGGFLGVIVATMSAGAIINFLLKKIVCLSIHKYRKQHPTIKKAQNNWNNDNTRTGATSAIIQGIVAKTGDDIRLKYTHGNLSGRRYDEWLRMKKFQRTVAERRPLDLRDNSPWLQLFDDHHPFLIRSDIHDDIITYLKITAVEDVPLPRPR